MLLPREDLANMSNMTTSNAIRTLSQFAQEGLVDVDGRHIKILDEKALERILKKYKDKRVLIVGHSTAMAVLLSKWCDVNLTGPYTFKEKEIFDGKWDFCETFKLLFNDKKELISIKNL